MSDTKISELLNSFVQAVESDALGEAQQYLERIEERYRAIEVEESVRQSQALQARDQLDIPTKKRETLDSYVQTANATNMSRAGFLATGAVFVSSPESTTATTVTDSARKLRDQEQTLADRESSAETVLDDVSLPARVDIVSATVPDGPHPKGNTVTATVVVQNVGDTTASGVKLSQESGASVSPSSVSVGTLEAGQQTKIEFTTETTGEDSVTIDLQLRSEDAGKARQRIEFEISDKGELASNASSSLTELIEYLRDSKLPKGRTKSLVSKLEAAQSRVSNAESFIERGNPEQANKMFTAAIN